MQAPIFELENISDFTADFSCIARKIVSRHIKSAVLIDDDWPSDDYISNEKYQSDLNNSENNTDPTQEYAEEKILDEEYEEDIISENFAEEDISDFPHADLLNAKKNKASNNPNADRLIKIHKSLVQRGIICTGLKYTAKEKNLASLLAKNSDILILDWNFGSDAGAGAIDILKELATDGQLRFVCIFTDQPDLSSIKHRIFKDIFSINQEVDASYDFKAGNFIFTLRNKSVSGIGEKYKSTSEDLFDDAVTHIAANYSGFLQLSMLEMTSRHRNTMLTHLTKFTPEFDAAIFADSSQEGSPAKLSENLRALLLDEWRIALEGNANSQEIWTLEEGGRKAYAISLKNNIGSVTKEYLTKCMKAMGITDAEKTTDLIFKKNTPDSDTPFKNIVGQWLDNGAEGDVPLGIKKAHVAKLTVAVLYVLSHPNKKGKDITPSEVWRDVLRLDALFCQQQILPEDLTQGTILKYDENSYFICITPLCDTVRLKTGYHAFSFLSATKAKPEEVLALSPDYCVFVENNEPVCLHIEIKRPYTFEFNDASRKITSKNSYEIYARHRLLPEIPVKSVIEKKATLVTSPENTIESVSEFNEGARSILIPFKVAGQLRGDFSFMITAASASNGSRVGINRVEFIRAAKVSK